MSHEPPSQPLPETERSTAEHVSRHTPAVFRGKAIGWPAVQRWTLRGLAALAPDRPVQLVRGNRELGPTRFISSTLGAYVDYLESADRHHDSPPLYLKEFDLLKAFPQLRADVNRQDLFPPGAITAGSTWLGPTGARTGLHHDYLDNLVVQVLGFKRFYLSPPGSVERAAAVSTKYDRWAQLSSRPISEIAGQQETDSLPYVVDLNPGDVLYVPARWWHEVVNLTPCLLFSGFFGPPPTVVALWARSQVRHALHLVGPRRRRDCTCHPQI